LASVYLLLVAFVYGHGMQFRAIDVLIYPSDLVLTLSLVYLLIVAFDYGHGMQFRAIVALTYPSDMGFFYLK
jgi:hypothetical protein